MGLNFPSSPTNGQLFENYIYDSSIGAWRSWNAESSSPVQIYNGGTGATTLAQAQDSLGVGLVEIVPQTILLTPPGGSATVNTAGEISFTNVTSVSLNNAFSSNYRYYKVVLSLSNSSAAGTYYGIRLRASGSDLSTASYDTQVANFSGGTWSVVQLSSQTYLRTGISDSQSTLRSFCSFDIANPNVAANTTITGTWAAYVGGIATGYLSNTTQYDGFTILFGNGTSFSGTVQVFGYNS